MAIRTVYWSSPAGQAPGKALHRAGISSMSNYNWKNPRRASCLKLENTRIPPAYLPAMRQPIQQSIPHVSGPILTPTQPGEPCSSRYPMRRTGEPTAVGIPWRKNERDQWRQVSQRDGIRSPLEEALGNKPYTTWEQATRRAELWVKNRPGRASYS